MVLDEVSRGRDNNLNLLRFLAAVMVVLCHAFPIALGKGKPDPLLALTNDQISFGSLAVGIFFVYGGFLICKSMCRIQTMVGYFKARIIRIFPPLIAVTVFLAFIAGPLLSKLSVVKYFTNAETYRYLTNGVLILYHNLPGVFVDNIYGQAVNGPLWTLPIEFLCYVMCFVAYKCKLLDKKSMIVTTVIFSVGCIGANILSGRIPMLASMIQPMGLFFAGMIYYVYREYIPMRWWLCAISFAGMAGSLIVGIFPYTVFLFFPYFFMYIGFGAKIKCSGFARHGEISYGMYLTAWPIQQVLSQYMSDSSGMMNPYINFGAAVILSMLTGILICKGIEEPVAKWAKQKENRRNVAHERVN